LQTRQKNFDLGDVQYYPPGLPPGSYTYQVTAINDFGSASATQTVTFATGPQITVTPVKENLFQVNGTGFDEWNGHTLTVDVNAGAALQFPAPPQPTMVNNQGELTAQINTAEICGKAGSNATLRFSVGWPQQPGSIGNIVTSFTCP
jgi:hypothetical protein